MDQSPRDGPSSEPLSSLSVTELVARVTGEKKYMAFEILYERYKKPLGSRLLHLVNDQEAAYDLYQDIFARIWEYFSQQESVPLKVVVHFEQWLYRAAANRAFDYLRHNKM